MSYNPVMIPARNQAIAGEFLRIAENLERRQANPYRIAAYRRAARLIQHLTEDAGDLARRGALIKMKGIGRDLAQKVATFCETGRMEADPADVSPLSPEVVAWLTLPGFTPALARHLSERLCIRTLDDLEALVRSRLLRTLPEVTATDEQILEGIARLRTSPPAT